MFISEKKIYIKLVLTLMIIISQALISYNIKAEGNFLNVEKWEFKQEIFIKIDTSSPQAKYKPIDIKVNFNNTCWAINESYNSICMGVLINNKWYESESQIYDLIHADDINYIDSCRIVFLIPKEADGTESYFILYDDNEMDRRSYKDHVDSRRGYFSYNKIPGYNFDSYHFQIIQENTVIFCISYDGEFLGMGGSQHVMKIKNNTENIDNPKVIGPIASFDLYVGSSDSYSSSMDVCKNSEIIIDGNILTEVLIISESKNQNIKTIGRYKYYYCPDNDKRIYANIRHEIKQGMKVTPNIENYYINFASMNIIQASSFKEVLNFGDAYSFFHYYSESENIVEEKFPSFDNIQSKNKIISYNDDKDLGKKPWICFDNGEQDGPLLSLIFQSNCILKDGDDENDGIQISLKNSKTDNFVVSTEQQGIGFARNSRENNIDDNYIPSNYAIEFTTEYYYTSHGDWKTIENESDIFKNLSIFKNNDESDSFNSETYTVDIISHFAPSFPITNFINLLTRNNKSYIQAELWKDGSFIDSKILKRSSFIHNINLLDLINIDEYKTSFSKILSIFKRAEFSGISNGTYLCKIIIVNPFFSDESLIIGYKMIEVHDNSSFHIFCKLPGRLIIKSVNQEKMPLSNLKIILKDKSSNIVAAINTNEFGLATLSAPYNTNDYYHLIAEYNSIPVFTEKISIKKINLLFPIKKYLEIPLYNVNITLLDDWNQLVKIPLDLSIFLEGFDAKVEYTKKNSTYILNNLISGDYHINVQYKSFRENEAIYINNSMEITFNLNWKNLLKINLFDFQGFILNDGIIILSKSGKSIQQNLNSEGVSYFSVPPGEYSIRVTSEGNQIGKCNLNLYKDDTINFITFKPQVYKYYIYIFSTLIIFIGVYFYLKTKKYISFIQSVSLHLVVLSTIFPWWSLYTIKDYFINIYIIPSHVIKYTRSSDLMFGEIVNISAEFTLLIRLITVLIFIGSIFLFMNIIMTRSIHKRLNEFFLFVGVLMYSISCLSFIFSMSYLLNFSGVGFFGSGEINSPNQTIWSTWGPNIGFYLFVASLVILIVSTIFKYNTKLKKIIKKNYKLYLPFISLFIIIFLILNIGIENIIDTFSKIPPIIVLIVMMMVVAENFLETIQWQMILNLNSC